MSTTQNSNLEALYKAMMSADDAFQAAVVRQFGRNRSGDMRYVGSKHNAQTKAAAEAYWLASHEYLEARAEVL